MPERRPGGPQTFSEAAIQFCLLIKFLFGLALRQAIGMGARLRKLAVFEDWPVPDYSTLCRRQKDLTVAPVGPREFVARSPSRSRSAAQPAP